MTHLALAVLLAGVSRGADLSAAGADDDVARYSAAYAARDWAQARRIAEPALERLEKDPFSDPLRVALWQHNLACVLRREQAYERAESLYRQALQTRRGLLDAEHLDVADTLNGLGLLYAAQGRDEEALSAYLESLRIRRRHVDALPGAVATTLANLAALHRKRAEPDIALECYREALAVYDKAGIADDPNLVALLHNLEQFYRRLLRDNANANAIAARLKAVERARRRGSAASGPVVWCCVTGAAALLAVGAGFLLWRRSSVKPADSRGL
ncbi:MAG: tetratricopeptide repeat protein [Kiritimatiellae bacterium]|nr:tetratricopeptide repeat protein [Kiritimatiellia bacterium]